MLWRQGYQPVVYRGVSQSELRLPYPMAIGASSLELAGELMVWQRLMESGGVNDCPILLFTEGWTPEDRTAALLCFPPSLHAQIQLLESALPDLAEAEKTFAYVGDEVFATLFVVGKPTEEVWEEIEDLIEV